MRELIRHKKLIAVVFLSLAGNVIGQEGVRIGVGSLQCAEYLKIAASSSEDSKRLVVSWVQGFLTGLNFSFEENERKSIPDPESLQAHLLLYCKSNASRRVIGGVMELFAKLPARSK